MELLKQAVGGASALLIALVLTSGMAANDLEANDLVANGEKADEADRADELVTKAQETDQHGRSHAWKGPSQSYTLIDFSASWCVPCRKSLPRLEALARDTPNLRVLVVSVDDEVAGRDALVADLGLTLPVLWDASYAIAEHHKPAGMPSTVILDPSGVEVFREEGYSEKKWRQLVEFVQKLPLTGETGASR